MSMDARSLASLKGVHPDLICAMNVAYDKSPVPFVIIQGMRSLAQEIENVRNGASLTMHSRHLPNEAGYACAVDVVARPGGKVDWTPRLYQGIASAVLAAGHTLDIPVEWGGNWTTLKDFGHFQLPWAVYP